MKYIPLVGPSLKDKYIRHMVNLEERNVTNELCREKESLEFLPEYPTDSNMEMETIMKRPEVNLEDAKDADKWKSKVMNTLESKFTSIASKSSTDVGQTNLHTLDVQVTEGSPVFVKQYTILLKYQNLIDDETKRLEEAGWISACSETRCRQTK